MATPDARKSGSHPIGGDLEVVRLGFGAMRLTGPGIWGPPTDRSEAERVLRRLLELGTNFVDTADSYGPFDSEELIGQTFTPLPPGVVVATKGGLTRQGPDRWAPVGRPEYLRQCVLMSLRRLKRDRIDLWQLHRVDPKVPRDEQFQAIAEMQREGLIRHVGLSEVTVDQIEAASKSFKVATVQNLYNLVNRQSEDVLEYAQKKGIGFIPWFPLSAGSLASPGGPLEALGRKYGVTPSAVALAWLLRRSRVMLPIPGTSKVKHLEENAAGAEVRLTEDEFRSLDVHGKQQWKSSQAERR